MNRNMTPIATAVAILIATTGMAQAQQAAPAEQNVVVVTGVRAALAQSINQKRNADSLVEVITAEDVGKMPDKSVADSLQRVPGVSVATAGGSEGGFGENDRVSLKGTPSNLALTTLNGHTVSSGDWYISNITNGGRSVSYSMFWHRFIGLAGPDRHGFPELRAVSPPVGARKPHPGPGQGAGTLAGRGQ